MTTAETASVRRAIDRRFLVQFALGSAIPLGLVAAAILPRRPGAVSLPAMHLHAPELWRIAAAPPAVQIHLAGIGVAIGVGVVLMTGVKGSLMHRMLGWTWVLAMMTGAVSSLFIRMLNHGAFSYIHLLSGWTIIALPMAVAAARSHRIKLHARLMTGLFTGGLVFAGTLAFVPGRLMWELVFS
jgi:uncharacterized membrane protein